MRPRKGSGKSSEERGITKDLESERVDALSRRGSARGVSTQPSDRAFGGLASSFLAEIAQPRLPPERHEPSGPGSARWTIWLT